MYVFSKRRFSVFVPLLRICCIVMQEIPTGIALWNPFSLHIRANICFPLHKRETAQSKHAAELQNIAQRGLQSAYQDKYAPWVCVLNCAAGWQSRSLLLMTLLVFVFVRFDRDLSVAGRVLVRKDDGSIASQLVGPHTLASSQQRIESASCL